MILRLSIRADGIEPSRGPNLGQIGYKPILATKPRSLNEDNHKTQI